MRAPVMELVDRPDVEVRLPAAPGGSAGLRVVRTVAEPSSDPVRRHRSDGEAVSELSAMEAMGVPLPELEIHRETSDSRVVLAVSGEIDMATVDSLCDALAQAADRAGEIWLDLTDVEFMDSTGITAVVRAHHATGDGYGRFTVICPGEGPVYRALEICGLHDVLRVYPSRAAAAAA